MKPEPKEMPAERLREWYDDQGEWSEEYSFEWFRTLPMVESGQRIYEAHISHLERGLTEAQQSSWANRRRADSAEGQAARAEQRESRLREALQTIADWPFNIMGDCVKDARDLARAALAAPAPRPRMVPDTEEVKAAREWADRNLEIGELYNADYLARYASERSRQARQEALAEIHNRFCGEGGKPCQVCLIKAEEENK